MKQRFAKFIALALAVIMIVTAFPVSAYTGAQNPANGNDRRAAKDFLDWIAKPIADQFKPTYPAQSMEDNVLGGTSVHVDAPRGALPADTELDVVTIADLDAVQDAFNAASDERGHVFTAVDINFINNGEEVDPRKPVTVILDNSVIANLENIRLVHFKGGADEIDTAEMEVVEQFYVSGQTITFDAEDFSVYAVIGDATGENARLQVRFFYHDDDTEPAYVVNVTQRDIDILGTIIEDPELPEVNEGEMFCGWSVGNAYTTADIDGQHTIDYIRAQVRTRLASPVTEGQTFDVYAMVYKYFNVAYVDENGATTLDFQTIFSKDNSINYTIYHLYTPEEQGYRFTGWQKDDGDDTVYQNNSEVTITNTLTTLRAQVQQGYWLTFEENPGGNFKGATYNAPIFCPHGNIPSNARPTPNPELAGYDFGGWYTTYANGTWSNQFSFTGTISQDTTVYAKWTLKSSVPYTLIVWKQSVNDDKNAAEANKTYDYAFSTTLNAAPNTNVSALDLSYFKTTHTYTVDSDTSEYGINTKPDGSGTWNNFFGFKYNSTHQAASGSGYVTIGGGVTANNTTVLPNGSTVVNLYWDRELVTYTFLIPTGYSRATSVNFSSGVYYYYENGTYYPITNHNSAGTYGYYVWPGSLTSTSSNTYFVLIDNTFYALTYSSSYYDYYFTYNGSTYWMEYNSSLTVYRRVSSSSSSIYVPNYGERTTFSGLYGQRLVTAGYTWPTDYRWFNSASGSTFTSIEDTFGQSANEDPADVYHTDFYGRSENFNTNVYHFLMDENGNWPASANYTIPTQTGNGMVFRSFQGFTRSVFRINLPSGVTTYTTGTEYNGDNLVNPESHTAVDGWTDWFEYGTGVEYEGNTRHELIRWNATEGGIQFRYTRNKYRIHYMVGKYADGNGNAVDGPMAGQLKQSPTIYYEASIDSYKVGGANYYDPISAGDFTDESFIFDGWYVDPGCTTAYDFTGKTMPLNGVTVYAKFIKRQYRVFLEPNLPSDPNFQVQWAESSQAMNFRVDYLGQISDGQPIEASDANGNYVLVGWYIDEACTEPYNFATRLNDEIAVNYPKTEPTESNGTNGDINRPWITKKVVIYAKWRKVLSGANGITVRYNAIEQENVAGHTGTFAELDGTPTYWEDPLRYMDKATAYTRTASTPDIPKDWQFLYWEILDKNGNGTGIYKHPGQDFEVDAQYAVEGTITLNPVYGTRSTSVDTKAGETWVEYTDTTIDTSKTYLIGFEVDGTVYLMVSYNASQSGNARYYVSDSNYNYYGYTAPAVFNGGKIVGVSGNATDLQYCQWNFSSTTGGNITSVYGSRYLYASAGSYVDLYPDRSEPSYNWTWNASANTLRYNNNKYASYYSYDGGNNMRAVTTTSGNDVTVKLYVQDDSGSGSDETVTYKKVDAPVVGVPYVIVSDAADAYALSKDHTPNSFNADGSDSGNASKSWLLAVVVTKTGDTIAVPADSVNDVTWVAGGNAANGYTWRNVANSEYLDLTDYDDGYLTTSSTALAWLYDSSRRFNNQVEAGGYYYLYLDTSSTDYYDYSVAKASSADAISIYARAYNLTVNYVMADGTTAPTAHNSQVAQGEDYSVTVPSITGYTPSQTTVSGTMGTSDVEVTVTYTKNAAATYTVTFQDWDGTVLKTQTVTEGQAATAPADPSRAGYTFTGWDVDFSNVTSNLTVTAQYEQNSSQGEGHYEWKPVTTIVPDDDYLIGFVVGDTVYLAVNYNETATNHYYYNNSSNYLGYTGVAIRDGEIVTGVTGNATNLDYCTWTFSTTTGGTITSGSNSNYYLRTYSSTGYNDLYPDTSNTYATNWVWNSANKTLTRSVNGTTMYAEYASAGGTGNYMGVFTEHSSSEYVQLYHKEWVEEQVAVPHTVTFVDGYTESIIHAYEVEDGGAMPATPATPDHSNENYYFVRWNPDPANYTTVTEDLTFTAYYEFQQAGHYLVTFKDWNGRVLSTQTVAEGESASAPADPTRPGYNFTGWDKDFSEITSNLVVYATYSKTVTKTYTVTLRATYGPRVIQEKTHITWHANNNTGDYKNSTDVIMNETIAIEYPEADTTTPGGAKADELIWGDDDNLVWEDHVFLGWARIPISDTNGNIGTEFMPTIEDPDTHQQVANPDYTKVRDLNEDDLFLKYVYPTEGETHGYFLAKFGDEWKPATAVAADEIMPYHGMYAVWASVFYVYHSGTNQVEKIVRTTKDGTYDLAGSTTENYLYAGYYKYYDGVSGQFTQEDGAKVMTWDDVNVSWNNGELVKDASWAQQKQDAPVNGTAAKAYNGYNVKWTAVPYKQADNADYGTELNPVAGTTYYIKEVPADKYLRPYLHYTYYLASGSISTAWLISDVDLSYTDYLETGYVVKSANDAAEHIVRSLTVTTTHGDSSQTLTATSLFRTRGYLNYLTVINHGSNGQPVVNLLNNGDTVAQYWVTPDGLRVTGYAIRTYQGLDNINSVGIASQSDSVANYSVTKWN